MDGNNCPKAHYAPNMARLALTSFVSMAYPLGLPSKLLLHCSLVLRSAMPPSPSPLPLGKVAAPSGVLCICAYDGQQHASLQHLPGTSVSPSTHQRDSVGSLFPSTEGLAALQRSRATQAELEAKGKG